jgi:hypothetical protein
MKGQKALVKKQRAWKSRVPHNPESNPQRLPQLTDQLSTGITLRFTTTGTGGSASTTVTFQNLLDAWCIAVSSTAGYQLFDFVKVRRVTVRAVSNPGLAGNVSFLGAQATVGVEFPSLVAGTQAGGKQASQTEMGTASIACCSLSPGRMTAAGMWQASSGNVAFVVRAVDWNQNVIVGAIIDVELSYKNSADVNPAACASALTGATTGAIYFRGIDGAAPAATWARSTFVPRI